MSFGLYTRNNMSGLINSNYPQEVVVASGSVSYSGGTVESDGLDNVFRHRSLTNVTLSKHVTMDMAETYNIGNNYGRLKVTCYYHTTGGHAVYYGGSISETSSTITFGRLDVDSGNHTGLSATSISGTLYIVLTASLWSFSQIKPVNGICFYTSSGQVSFNSNYMPVNPYQFVSRPSPNLGNLRSYNTGRRAVSGLSNSDKPMVPMAYVGRGGVDSFSIMTNVTTVYNSDGYVSARSSGYTWTSPYPPTKYGYFFISGSTLVPVLRGSDFF